MPRRSILSAAERDSLLALPDAQDELIRHYTFSEPDLSLIRQRRGDANRLGVAVQLCLLRFPGQGLLPDASVPPPLLQWIGRQLRLDPVCWPQYAERLALGPHLGDLQRQKAQIICHRCVRSSWLRTQSCQTSATGARA